MLGKIRELLLKHYSITPTHIKPTDSGSGFTYLITTNDNLYIGKVNSRPAFITLYDKVQPILKAHGLKQSKIIKTIDNQNFTDEHFVLYEYIKGETIHEFNSIQKQNALNYMRKYHEILKMALIKEKELPYENHWDKLTSIDYLIAELSTRLKQSEVNKGLNILSKNKVYLNTIEKQLIHSDLGPDNFVFSHNEVVAIIDFTPSYHHELYALSQFFYWNELWLESDVSHHTLIQYLHLYKGQEKDLHLFQLLLLQATLARILGSIIAHPDRPIEKRLSMLRKVLQII